jgi:hypothetical protein
VEERKDRGLTRVLRVAYGIILVVTRQDFWRWTRLVVAVALLNASLTFDNVWPTPAIRWQNQLSLELAVVVLAMVLAWHRFGPPSRTVLRLLGFVWILLAIGHYGYVTAPALFGRDINLYWDLGFVPAVVGLLAKAAPFRVVLPVAAAIFLMAFGLYALFRWALGLVGGATADRRQRLVLGSVSGAVIVLFLLQQTIDRLPLDPELFAVPITRAYADQVRLGLESALGAKTVAPSPRMDSDFAFVKGADVFLIFIESYGAISFERPDIAPKLTASQAAFDAAIHETHRDVVSAYVESPTFGGKSWLAHLSLMSGVEVRDPDTNSLLMAEKRDTVNKAFSRHGFRSVALMPGLQQHWPEGAFYGFDRIYDAASLDYHGPQFGWFTIPDQFTIEKFDEVEVSRPSRPPLFVFYPTISSHTPFLPLPPNLPSWGRVLTDHPYDDVQLQRALERQPDWLNLGASYVEAISYTYEVIGGYLRARSDRDFVMILLGDHQPPSAVSGEAASWDVPVHVVASRRQVLDRLRERGFRSGLRPARPSLGPMNTLLPILLDAFGNRESVAASR